MAKPHGSLAVRFVKKEGVSRPFGHYWFLPTEVGFYEKKLIYLQGGGGYECNLKIGYLTFMYGYFIPV
jgi:hypothetical protein